MAYYKTSNNHTKKFSKAEYALVIEAIRYEYQNNPVNPLQSLTGLAPTTPLQEEPVGVRIVLDIEKHSELQEISYGHIENIISWLEIVEKVVFDRSPIHHEPTRPFTIPITIRQDPSRFHLIIPDSFNNWYAGHTFRRNTTLNDLSLLNLEKIYNLIVDITEQLQMKPTEKVTIKIDSLNVDKFPLMSSHIIGNSRIMADFRKDALDFLEHELVVSYYKIVPELETIAIIINIEEFNAFKNKVETVYKTRAQEEPADKEIQSNDEVSYTVTYNEMTGEILINERVFKKTRLDSLADNIFAYLNKNPNRKITINELKKATRKTIKDLPKIIENAGFTGNRLKVFFRVSKDAIYFRPQITKADLEKLNLSSLD